MITICKKNDVGLETLDAPTEGCWVHVTAPTGEETARLSQELGVPQDFITAPLDLDERARVEREDSVMLILLRVPHYQGDSADIPYITVPLGIILTKDAIATVCSIELDLVRELSSGRVRGLVTARHPQFILRLLLIMAGQFLSNLRHINRVVDEAEDRLYHSLRNREVVELLKYQKSLVYFTTALKSDELILQHLQKSRLFHQDPDDEDLLDDVVTEVQQAIEMTNISGNILSQMMDAYASIISNNLNLVMKFLASVTIILSLPTMLASFYGMNVHLPLESSPWAFAVILGISVVVAAVVTILFWRRDWL